MNDALDFNVLPGLLPRLKLQTAQLEFGPPPAPFDRALPDWLRALPTALLGSADDAIAEYGLSVTADFERWTYRASGDTDTLIAPLAAYFARLDVPASELNQLQAIGQLLDPDQLGSWIEVQSSAQNAGWYITGPIELASALTALPVSEDAALLRTWLQRHALDTVSYLARALGAGDPHAEVRITLAATDALGAIKLALELYDVLQVPTPTAEVLKVLLNAPQPHVDVSVWLNSQGVVKIGLMLPQPTRGLALDLARLSGQTSFEPLATLEGILGVELPVAVEWQQRAAGAGAEFHYRVAGEL